jgi:hypothetical protein
MADGLLEGVLGEEPERSEVEPPEPLARAEAFAAAVAALASRQDSAVARRTEEFLAEQSELLRAQKKLLDAEHPLVRL